VLVAPDGRRAYVSTHFETTVFGLTVIDLAPLRVVGRLVIEGAGFTDGGTKPASFPLASALRGNRLYLAFGGGLAVVDVSDAAAPRLEQVVPLGMQAVHLAIDGDVAVVVGASPARLVRLDLKDGDTPVVVRSEPLPGRPTGVALGATRVAVATGERGVVVLPR
jgi:hypothetical protein